MRKVVGVDKVEAAVLDPDRDIYSNHLSYRLPL